MKVIILLSCLEIGGAEIQAFNLAKYLKSQNIEVEVVGISSTGHLTTMLDAEEIPWKFIKFNVKQGFVSFILELIKFALQLRKEKADVILSYTLIPNVVGALIWKFIGIRLFVWGQRDEGKDECNRRIMNLAFKSTKHFVSNSITGASYLINECGVSQEKIKIINNSYYPRDVSKDSDDWQSVYDLSRYNLVANMVGNLSKVKDHITLLKAWKIVVDKLNSENSEIKPLLLLAGRFDATTENIKSFIVDNEMESCVKLLNGVVDIAGLHAISDIFLYSSFTEGSPNAVIEAMMAKLPIVASDIPAIRYIFPEANYNFLAKPLDEIDLLIKL
jgi:glycosyltransferase involved in cell wall biosynthesis